ncbi:MAG: ankyrin repeat domain-containing protein [Limisphaerales bacterium]
MDHAGQLTLAHRAFCDDNPAALRELLIRHSELRALVNAPQPDAFDSPPIVNVKSRGMLDLLLEFGADLNAKSRWWAGGFGLLHSAPPDLAHYAIERGARVDIHAAARLGLFERLRELIAADPSLVHARGGDGQTPLHFASTREIAACLLDHGADIDARDIDHESTPAQYMIGDRPELARFLVERGCKTDLLMAAALNDLALARQHLDRNPDSIRLRVSDDFFPMSGKKAGGTIYQWVLGWHVSPHQVAKNRGHNELFYFLMERSPAEVKLLNAAWLHDEQAVDSILSQHREIVRSLADSDLRQTAHAARNNDSTVLRLLLKAGLPLNTRGQHHATPLHWAAWHGNVAAVRLLLHHKPAPNLEDSENDFKGTPLQWALHGSENGWHRRTGDYPATVEALLRAGAKPPPQLSGTPEVRSILQAWIN